MGLIDADKLKQDVLDWQDCYNGFSDTYDKSMIIDEIDAQPTVEAEPVVRCKDCRYWETVTENAEYGICTGVGMFRERNFYCADGEKFGEVNDEDN